ncbi:hypothetical protein KKG46_00275 [Patescibacteria group bacterium]|nr:hypothetical protein [Patescibacteria group bacterium]
MPTERIITPLIGQPFTVYHVLNPGFPDDEIFCTELNICKELHMALWSARDNSTIKIPNIYRDILTHEFPPLHEFHYADCPHCGAELRKYGYVKQDWMQTCRFYCDTLEEAERKHEEGRQTFLKCQENVREQLAQKIAEEKNWQLYLPASRVSDSKSYSFLSGNISTDLLKEFEECYYSVVGRDVADHIAETPKYEAFSRAAAAVKDALDDVYNERWNEMVEKNWIELVRPVLQKHNPRCLLCGQVIDYTDEMMEDLLIYGEVTPQCNCPERGWSLHKQETPDDLTRLFTTLNQLPRVQSVNMKYPVYYRVARNIQVNNHPVLRILFTDSVYQLRAHIAINTQLIQTPKIAFVEDLVPAAEERCRREHLENLEKEVQKGNLLKLHLSWNERHQSWGVRRTQGNETVVYTVARGQAHTITPTHSGWFYCSVVAEPPKSKKPGFKLVLISPREMVPGELEPHPVKPRGIRFDFSRD